MPNDYISRITLPIDVSGTITPTTFEIKDAEARALIEALQGVVFHKCSEVTEVTPSTTPKTYTSSDTPVGVIWYYQGCVVTGTLTATAAEKSYIYLVPSQRTSTKDIYEEYIPVNEGTTAEPTWSWEKIGDTDFNFDLDKLKDKITFTKGSGSSVLGSGTTVTNSSSSVSYGNDGTSDTFVKSYPGVTSKLVLDTIKGVGSDVTFNAVDSNTSVTATNTVFGTDTTASKITTASKTATNLVLGTATTASKATAGTAVDVAKTGTTVQNVVTSSSAISSLVTAATYDSTTETVSFSYINSGLSRSNITPAASNGTITPYTFSDVTVPVVTSNTSVTFDAVSTNTDVTVPVVSSNDSVTATNTTTTSKTAATAASSAQTFATGALSGTGTGDSVLTGLGTPTTATAITGLPTATAAAQTATVDQSHLVTALTPSDVSLTVDQNAKVIRQ